MKAGQSSAKKNLRAKAVTSSIQSLNLSASFIPDNAMDVKQNLDERGGIEVAVRVRPLSQDEIAQGVTNCCEVSLDDNSVVISKKEKALSYLKSQMGVSNEYTFDCAFDESISQIEIYTRTAKPLIDKVLKGYNATIFAYGATGAGKTFTMLGDLKRDSSFTSDGAGIIPNCVRDLIYTLNQQNATSKEIVPHITSLSVSYFEVYNEQVYDLLDANGQCLSVREDQEKCIVVVAGATEVLVESENQVMQLLSKGSKNRKTESTMANQVSSRSHAVFQLIVNTTRYSDRGQPIVTTSKLSLIDLAGSERASATNNRGIRLVEGANINKSLLALANCINALSENSHTMNTRRTNVKYRDSKLTHLLKSSLEGHCYLVMIANVNPSDVTYEDSHNTLKYANRAKSIKINPEIKESVKRSDFLERENRLREEKTALKTRVLDLEKLVTELQLKLSQFEELMKSHHHQEQKVNYGDVYSSPSHDVVSYLSNPIRLSRKRSMSEFESENVPRNIETSSPNIRGIKEIAKSASLSPIKKTRPSNDNYMAESIPELSNQKPSPRTSPRTSVDPYLPYEENFYESESHLFPDQEAESILLEVFPRLDSNRAQDEAKISQSIATHPTEEHYAAYNCMHVASSLMSCDNSNSPRRIASRRRRKTIESVNRMLLSIPTFGTEESTIMSNDNSSQLKPIGTSILSKKIRKKT